MKWLEFFRRGDKKRSLPPIRTVQTPGSVRRERLERDAPDDEMPMPVAQKDERDDLFDTGSLEIARDPGDGDNPYDTQTWQVDTPKGPRRVDDLKAVNKKRVSGTKENPYDTIVSRKGW